MKTSPLGGIDVTVASVNIRVKIAKRFGNRLDALVVHARRRVQGFGRFEIADVHGLREFAGLGYECVAFPNDVFPVLVDGRLEIRFGDSVPAGFTVCGGTGIGALLGRSRRGIAGLRGRIVSAGR
ncbi:hypothetical protein D3C76_1427710 [compost metagenome]